MRDEQRFAAAHMVRIYGLDGAIANALLAYAQAKGENASAGESFWDYVIVAIRELRRIPTLRTDQLIIRSIRDRGEPQRIALLELDHRGMALSEGQKIQAGLACEWPRA